MQQFQQQYQQPVYDPQNPQQYAQQSASAQDYGPRRVSFFTLVLKVFAGTTGGVVGSVILLLIFLVSSSILQPVLSPAEAKVNEVSPLFIVILMGMIFATSVASSIISPLLLSYTERERYPRITTSLYQIFIFNLIIFAFVTPIYLTTSVDRLELSAYAAGLQVVLSALSSALIVEIMNDYRYALIGVYTSILGVLVATAFNLLVYKLFGSPTALLFTALPITWASIGFFQAAFAMIYYWYFSTWGKDSLATDTSLGSDYGVQTQEPVEPELPPDQEGSDFLKNG